MVDIVFVFPSAPTEYVLSHHLGTGYIRSYISQHNIETAQCYTSHEMTIPDIVAEILAHNSDLVGFTCYDTNYAYVRILARMLKKKNPYLTIILGGPTATFSYKEIMAHTPEFDACVIGEGEQTTLELLQKGCSDLESIKGIAFRSGNQILSTPPRPLISGRDKEAELDVLPSPYVTGFIPPDGKVGILTARGCVYHCTYCNFSAMFGHTIRYHSVDRVITELALIGEHWDAAVTNQVTIHDDIFSLHLKRAKTICQKIIDEGINLPFFVETRADNCDKELIELMKEAGVIKLNFGLESASCSVLKTIKKPRSQKEKQFLTQIKSSVTWAKKAGIKTSVSIILGLPGESPQEGRETLNFVKELQVDEYFHNYLLLFAGTELFSTRKKYNLDVVPSPSFLPYKTQYTYDVREITPLPNSDFNEEVTVWKKTYSDIISYRVDKTQDIKYLVLKKMPENMDHFCTWLQSMCVMHLLVVDTTDSTKEEVNRRKALLLQGGVPVGYYCHVKDGCLNVYGLTDLSIPLQKAQFHQGKGDFFTLETSQDMEALSRFYKDHVTDGILSFQAQKAPKIINTCKWGESVCSALSGSIVVVDGDAVVSCFDGVCVGSSGDTLDTLRENLQNMLRKTEKERGCQECSVNTVCSRCLAPHPFTDDEFCTLKRVYNVSKLVTLFEWVYSFAGDNQGILALRVDESAPPLFYHGELSKNGTPLPRVMDTVRLVSFDGEPVIFTTDAFRSFLPGAILAAILEACQIKVDTESLVSYLMESETIDAKEALNAVQKAVSLLREKGFLTNP